MQGGPGPRVVNPAVRELETGLAGLLGVPQPTVTRHRAGQQRMFPSSTDRPDCVSVAATPASRDGGFSN